MTEPVTQTMSASQAQQAWDELLDRVGRRETRVLVERDGTPVAAIISVEDLHRLTRFERERARRFKALDEIAARNGDKDPDEVEREIAGEIAAMRQEQREQAGSRPSSD